jgi:hypothetical protein
MTTYSVTLRNKFLCTHTSTFDEFIEALEQHVACLKEMRQAGVELEPDGIGSDYATFVTTDPKIAETFGMESEPEEDKTEAV